MQTELLRIFREVAHRRSITAAAQALRYTQSTVSRQIAALEADFGARLIDRLPRGIVLTEQGRVLLGHAEAVLGRLEDARRDMRAVGDASLGRLRVAAFATALVALVPQALARIRAEFPAVELSLVEGLTPRLIERLAAGEADIAVLSTASDQLLDDPRLDLHHLLDEPMLVAVPRDHPLANGTIAASGTGIAEVDGSGIVGVGGTGVVELAALAGESWIAGGAGPQESLLAAGIRHGFRPRVEFAADEWFAKLGLVAAGLGITLLPALAARAAPPDIALLRLNPGELPPRTVYAATLAGRTRSAVVNAFLTELRSGAAAIQER
ncbi:LysR family transcriptional regulator [Actinoplanes couchii]|uniref:LysR family transcriptional regulator n=1 Tax=Actinoplanes couchii TaxID=403638 RepID=A0ABQ3XE79_9ACTN|nr:LysR substrate-binding domain-containing protein [Actinoplanes couchii]MDR6317321.1 DNA-binding transcriptional LysR family regulator [Actinoplanes couchii]GID56814.1 LysR family transcriptional regulator [Actinoplanes couchii]